MGLLDRILSFDVDGVSVAPVAGVTYMTDGKPLNVNSSLLPSDAPAFYGARAEMTLRRTTNGKPGDEIGRFSLNYQQARFHQSLSDDDIPFVKNLRDIDLPPPYDRQLDDALHFKYERSATVHLIFAQASWELGHPFYRSRQTTLANPSFGLGAGGAIITYPDRSTGHALFATGLLDVEIVRRRIGKCFVNATGGVRGYAGQVFGLGGEASVNLGCYTDEL